MTDKETELADRVESKVMSMDEETFGNLLGFIFADDLEDDELTEEEVIKELGNRGIGIGPAWETIKEALRTVRNNPSPRSPQ